MKEHELKRLIMDTFSAKESVKRFKELEKGYTEKLKKELEERISIQSETPATKESPLEKQ